MRFCKLDKGVRGPEATAASAQSELPWTCAYLEVNSTDADPHSTKPCSRMENGWDGYPAATASRREKPLRSLMSSRRPARD